MQTFREQIGVDGSAMNLFIARPAGGQPLPAGVVIQHQYGVDQFMEEMTARTAAAGYFAVTPDLYRVTMNGEQYLSAGGGDDRKLSTSFGQNCSMITPWGMYMNPRGTRGF